MFVDRDPPTGFGMDAWIRLRDLYFLLGYPYKNNKHHLLAHVYLLATYLNLIQEDYGDRLSMVAEKGRQVGEAMLAVLGDPASGWPPKTTQAVKLQSAHVQSQLPKPIIDQLHQLQSLSNAGAHHNLGSDRFQPSDKPRVANAAFHVCAHLELLLADRFPVDLARAQEWFGGACGGNELGAWLKAAKCEDYAQKLEDVKGIKCIDDLEPLLDESNASICDGMKGLMKEADAKRFVKALRSDFALWLRKVGCIDYKQQLSKMGYNSIDDGYELQDETDDFIRGKFDFIGQKKKAHLKKLLDGIRAIKL